MPATIVRCSVPDVDFSFISFFDFGDALRGQHLRDAQFHLHEVVDRDALVAVGDAGGGCRRGGRRAAAGCDGPTAGASAAGARRLAAGAARGS